MSRALSAFSLLFTLALPTSCRRPATTHDAAPSSARTDAAVRDAAAPRETAAPATAPWCFEPLPRADVRAIDDQGRVWTAQGLALLRDDRPTPVTLPDELPCPSRGTFAMEFVDGGAAFMVLDGRFYVRPSRDAAFVVTPACTDLAGAPWTRRTAGGWAFVANTWRSVGPGLLMTREASGVSGWYAITALDRSITAGVLDGQHSLLSLINEGRVVLVDQVQTVAGEVLAAEGGGFTTLSRSTAGVVAARDAADSHRVIVTAPSLGENFERIESVRDRGAVTRAVVVVDLARFVAVTDDSVELSVDHGRTFRTVLRMPPADAGGARLERPHVGRLRDGRLAVATRDGLAVDRCR